MLEQGLFINKFHIWCLRMCSGGFELILQASSTFWHDINRKNYQSTDSGSNGPSVAQRTQLRPLKTGQDQRGSDKEAQDNPLAKAGGHWQPWPLADQPMGPTAFSQLCGSLPLAPNVGSWRKRPWLPPINTRGGGENITHHHTHLSSQASCVHYQKIKVMKRTKSVAICLKLLQYVYLERTFLLEVVMQNSIAIGFLPRDHFCCWEKNSCCNGMNHGN